MILLFYNLALFVVLWLTAPWWIFRIATTHKYREGFLARLGRVPYLPADRPRIWLHAVSVGEVLAVTHLVSELDRAFPEYQVVISTTTRTGQALARDRFGSARVFYCPLDLPWAVSAYLNAIQPHLLILAETEFWPNFLSSCRRRQIPIAVVNARISDRSWPRYQSLRTLWRPFLRPLAAVLAQTQTDADRLLSIGCNPAAVTVAGNLKFDIRAAKETEATRFLQSAANGTRFLVAGSTLEGEEQSLLDAWPRILASDPNLILILAPRHPERFSAVTALLNQSGIPWSARSSWKQPPTLHPGQIVLLDTIGELASIYSLASAAFIGGSLIPAGGHNPLEPAQFATPIAMGPHYENFRAIVEDLLAHQALRITSAEDLPTTLIQLLADPSIGPRAKAVFDQQAGATTRCLNAIRQILTEEKS